MNTSAVKAMCEFDRIKFVCIECEIVSHKVILNKVLSMIEKIDAKQGDPKVIQTAEDISDIKNVVNQTEDEVKILAENVEQMKGLLVSNDDTGKTERDKSEKKRKEWRKVNEPVVIIVPREQQTTEVTKRKLMEAIDPVDVPISNVRNAARGSIILEGKTKKDVEQIAKCTEAKMGENFDIKITELKRPRMKIGGMSEKLDDEALIEKLKKQNNYLKDAEMKVIRSYGKKHISSIIEIDCDSFNEVMKERKINVGWNRCQVSEYIDVKMCFNCNGFNHTAAVCKNKKSCKKCAEEHDVTQCKSTELKCVNCTQANNKLNVGVDTNHAAFSRKCTVLNRRMNWEKKKVAYNKAEI